MSGQHKLPDLPYAYNALEPYISEQIMKLHHQKHHQTYVTALNAAEGAYANAKTPKERIGLQAALKFNGGGHINHSLFWKNLAPNNGDGGKLYDGALKKGIEQAFGSFDNFQKEFSKAALGIQGSGWAWLGVNPQTKVVEITTTANQDPLLTHYPVVGVDMWEHAFYLQYQNVKPNYLEAIWNVINWKEGEERYNDAVQKGLDAGLNVL
ncbi:manganese superoxide dismutase [Rickenella mellea]|uniref:Superoxide dismutase n=1 Tax=Rickenella mellea TaxID=50990 RepID=A0A4Y7QJU4_9AGAM|nr:manganese superoxide dismutase [Rickenella mellea]